MRLSRDFYVAVSVAVLISLLVTGWSIYVRRPAPDETLYVPRPAVMTPELELLRRYVQIDTSNPPGNETEGARFLIDELKRSGIEAELIESAPGRGNVYARIRGRIPGKGLLLLNHIDVVRANPGEWRKPPFAGEVDLNMMYGRGTLDMKGVAITQLLAFIDLARSGRTPAHDVVFLATADEEQGSRLGIEWLLANRPDVIEGVAYAVNEGGITEIVREQLVYFAIEVGSKQTVALELQAADLVTLREIRLDLSPEFTSRDPERILPEVRDYFKAIAPKRLAYMRDLEDIDRTVEEGNFWRLPVAYRALTRNDLVMGGPARTGAGYTAKLFLLTLPDVDPDSAIAQMKERLAPYDVEVRVLRKMGPAPISSASTPFFSLIVQTVQQEYGKDLAVGPFIMHGGTTDSRYLRGKGIHVYGLSPFPADFHQSEGIHGIDERVRLDWFMSGVRVMRELVRGYAMGGEST